MINNLAKLKKSLINIKINNLHLKMNLAKLKKLNKVNNSNKFFNKLNNNNKVLLLKVQMIIKIYL